MNSLPQKEKQSRNIRKIIRDWWADLTAREEIHVIINGKVSFIALDRNYAGPDYELNYLESTKNIKVYSKDGCIDKRFYKLLLKSEIMAAIVGVCKEHYDPNTHNIQIKKVKVK